MAQQTINVGAAPNDGTGTPLRTAFQYTNSNFTELYTAVGPSGNNIVVPGTATITGDLTVDTSTLKVDSANNRVGIGTATPATILHIQDASTLYQTIQTASGGAGTNYKRTGSTGATDWLVGHGAASASNKFEIFNSGSSGFEITSNNQLRYAISTLGVHTWEYVGGVAGTAMTLNSTGLGVGGVPSGVNRFAVWNGATQAMTLDTSERESVGGDDEWNLPYISQECRCGCWKSGF